MDSETRKSKPFQQWAAETWNAGDSVVSTFEWAKNGKG